MTNGQDLSGLNISVNAYEEGGFYYLLNISERMFNPSLSKLPNEPVGGILTLSANNTSPQRDNYAVDHVTSRSNVWSNPISVTAHNNAKIAYQYFENVLGRSSFDNRGATIYSFVNVADEDGTAMDNAFWNGRGIYYGNGNRSFSKPLAAALDVAAHELSHGVIQYTANLNYQNESGALNESFADIFAVLIERKNWAIGEEVVNPNVFPTGALRSLSNPNNGGTRFGDLGWQAKTVSEQYRGSENNGGVHINSGISNYAFYLFATDQRVGINVAEAVYYKTLRDYLSASSNFKALRRAVGQSITDLYGNDPDIQAAYNAAFDAVGIPSSNPSEPDPDPVNQYNINPGEDFIVWYQEDTQEIYIKFLSNDSDSRISQRGLINVPSISDDGRIMVFIGADKKMYGILFDWDALTIEEVLIDDRQWRNVAISKDGNKLAALMGDLSTNQYDNRLLIVDFESNTERWYDLSNPTTAQDISTSDVQFADAIKWDHTSQYVMYDALNRITSLFNDDIEYWDIGFIEVWDNGVNAFADGRILKLFPNLPEGISIGNPTFSSTSPDLIALDVLDSRESQQIDYFILGVNLETGDQGIIYDQNNTPGYPNFSRTDQEVIFNFNNNSNAGVVPVVATRAILEDGISGTGNATVKINNATWGTWFSNGLRDLSTSTEEYDPLNEVITIFPNPGDSYLHLSDDELGCQSCTLNIYQQDGARILRATYHKGSPIDISMLVPGIYTLRLKTDNGIIAKNFIKQ